MICFLSSCHDYHADTKTTAEVDTSVVDVFHDNDNGTNDIPSEHPKNLSLAEVMEPEGVAMDTDNYLVEHCHSLPVTPMKTRQSSSESSDYPKEHTPLLPRRSQSYEHIEEVTPALPGNHSMNSGSGGFYYRSNPLPSVGSAHDVLGECALFGRVI